MSIYPPLAPPTHEFRHSFRLFLIMQLLLLMILVLFYCLYKKNNNNFQGGNLCSMLLCSGLCRGCAKSFAKELNSCVTLKDQSSVIALDLGFTSARISNMLCRV